MTTCHFCDELKERLDKLEVIYEDINISGVDASKEFENICKLTKGDSVPVIIVGKNILAPDLSFKTIEEASLLVKKLVS